MLYKEPLVFDAMLNDVRDLNSSMLTTYLEVAITFTTRPQRPVGLVYAFINMNDIDHPAERGLDSNPRPLATASLHPVWMKATVRVMSAEGGAGSNPIRTGSVVWHV